MNVNFTRKVDIIFDEEEVQKIKAYYDIMTGVCRSIQDCDECLF